MVKGIIYNSNVEDLAKEPEVTIVPGVTIGEHDREYFYRDEKIDGENPAKEQSGYMERLWEFNQLKPSEGDKKVK